MGLLLCIPATDGVVQNLGAKLQKVLGKTKDITMFFCVAVGYNGYSGEPGKVDLQSRLILSMVCESVSDGSQVYIRIEGTVLCRRFPR